jgi:hypothetical protein
MVYDDDLDNVCFYLEKARTELYKTVQLHNRNAIKQNDPSGCIVLPPDDWKAEYDGQVITVHIPDYMPMTRKRVPGASERWVANMQAVLWSLPVCPTFDKAFIFIKVFAPYTNWDVDNKDVKAIINGIVRARVIPDDTCEHMAYGVDGKPDETPHTIVHIFSYDQLAIIIPSLCK